MIPPPVVATFGVFLDFFIVRVITARKGKTVGTAHESSRRCRTTFYVIHHGSAPHLLYMAREGFKVSIRLSHLHFE